MFSFTMPELILIQIIALIVFGPGKLPEVGKALGKGIQEFRRATSAELATKEETARAEVKAMEPPRNNLSPAEATAQGPQVEEKK